MLNTAPMGTFLNDLRYGIRVMWTHPGFTSITVATLAIGIAANTALFSVVNGVILNPLPFRDPGQLLTFYQSKPNFEKGSLSYPNFLDWRKDNHTFDSMAVYRAEDFTLTNMGEAEALHGEMISANFFSLLGVKPVIGRTFRPEEDRIGGPDVALISAGLWSRRFGSSPGVLGRTLTLGGAHYTVVGVIPSTFHLPIQNFRENDVFVSIGQSTNSRLQHRNLAWGIAGVGRLKHGITIEQARADMSQVTGHLAAAFPEANRGSGATLVSLKEEITGRIRPVLLLLLGAVFFVLLIGCVNVANLLLARSTGRAREFAIRAAIGASQGDLIRQLLAESVLLALLAGGLGPILAAWGTHAGLAHLPEALPRAEQVGLDARVLFFSMAVSLACGVLLGLVPALKTAHPDVYSTLRDGGRSATVARHRMHALFVISEMAISLVLLIGAGLMIRSLALLWNVDPGFNPHQVLLFGTALPPEIASASPDAIRASLRQLTDQLESVPGVRAASLSWGATPMDSDDEELFWPAGQPKPVSENDMDWALDYIVTPHYLRAMDIPLKRGRFFTPHDDEHARPVIVVDEIFAHKFFPHEDPIGKLINLSQYDIQAEIVGVAGHVKQWGLDTDASNSLRAQMYLPVMQIPDRTMPRVAQGIGVVLRSTGSPLALTGTVHRTIERISREQPMFDIKTMDDVITGSLAARRFCQILLETFAALAVLLSAIGLYGVISYITGQRTQEIGIRMALGAQPKNVMASVVASGLKMTLGGVAVGIAGALGLTHLLSNMLFGISAWDPLTFAGVTALLVLVALGALYLPARSAMHVDPIVALRQQ